MNAYKKETYRGLELSDEGDLFPPFVLKIFQLKSFSSKNKLVHKFHYRDSIAFCEHIDNIRLEDI